MKTASGAPLQWRTPLLIGTSVVSGTELVIVVENDFPVEVKVVSEDPVVLVIVVSEGVLVIVFVLMIVLTRPPGAVDSSVSNTKVGAGLWR